MKKCIGSQGSCLFPVLNILVAIILILTLLPHEVLAQTYRFSSNRIVPIQTESSPQNLQTEPVELQTPSPAYAPSLAAIPVPPTVSTVTPATNITSNSATLQGNLTNLGSALPIQVSFEYGLDTKYDSLTPTQDKTMVGFFSANITGLNPNTTYHYRAKASSSAGAAYGANATFVTQPASSPTPIPIPTPTPTPTPTATATPTPTPTPTLTPTPTPTPVASPVTSTVDLTGKVDAAGKLKEAVTASSKDNRVSLAVPVGVKGLTTSGSPLTQITVAQIPTLPPPPAKSRIIGLVYEFGPEGATFDQFVSITFTYNPAQLRPGITPSMLSISYYDAKSRNWLSLNSTVNSQNNIISAQINHFSQYAVITPVNPTVVVNPDQDAEIKSANNKIALKIPKSAVSEPVKIELIEHTPWDSTGMKIVNLFELKAFKVSSNETVTQFNQNLAVTINHEQVDLNGVDTGSLRLYYLDDKSRQWVPVPDSKYDKKQNVLTATTNHFSYYGEQANPLASGPGRVMAAQVSLQSGAAVFNYPLELPPGPGGFQPKLELTYNSGIADEMKNKRAMGSWVGIGWTMHLGRISLDSGRYYLELNGASYELFSTDNIYYRTNPDQYFKIIRAGNTWQLWDREGIYYRFGGTTDSEQYTRSDQYSTTYYRWDLSLMQNTNGRQATVSYVRDMGYIIGDDEGYYYYVQSAYPQYLRYSDNNAVVQFFSSYDGGGGSNGYWRKDGPINPAPKITGTRKLEAIEVKFAGNLVRKYAFTYTTTDRVWSTDYGGIYYSGKHSLTSITQLGADGTSQLPAMTLAYEDKQIYRRTTYDSYYGNPGNPASLSWPHLTTVNSGYGGSISFTYTQNPDTSVYDIWTREIVTNKTINSGIGTTESYACEYTGNPFSNPQDTKPQYLGRGWDQKYRGFGKVKKTDAAGNYIVHWFYTSIKVDGKDGEKLSGREYKTEWFNSVGVKLREKVYDWDWNSPTQTYDVTADWSNVGKGSDGLLAHPGGVGLYDGKVYVTDYDQDPIYGDPLYDEVQVFDEHGNYITKWGSTGSAAGQFSQPSDITVTSDGYLFVADTGNHRIQKFNSSGTYITQFGSYGSGNGQFFNPYGVAVDSSGNVYVADTWNNRIQKFVWNGQAYQYNAQWGSYGSGVGQFNYPYGVAVDSSGNIYVADSGNNRIQKYTLAQSQWSIFISGTEFSSPKGIDVFNISGTDYVYILAPQLQKYSTSGELLFSWPTSGGNDVEVLSNSIYTTRVRELNHNWVVQLKKVDETIGAKTSRVEYVYDDYGNIKTEKLHGDTSTNTDDATIWRVFYPNAVSGTFGLDSGNNTRSLSANLLDAQRFQNTSGNGILTKIEIQFEQASFGGLVRVGIYSDNNGVPGSLLLYAGDAGVHRGWVSIGGLNYSVTNNTYYWLACLMTSAKPIRYQSGQAANSHYWNNYAFGDLPGTFPLAGAQSYNDPTVMRATTTSNIYILSKPAEERVYATITGDVGGSNLKKETFYYYDSNNSSYTTPPVKGNLTRVEQKKDASNSVSTYYTYDTNGNKLTSQDPNSNTTTWTYDGTYHIYPATKTYPAAGGIQLSESYTYDSGTNNLLSQVDVNSQTTSYAYDTFKRPTAIDKPLGRSPDITYAYTSWGTINQQHILNMTYYDQSNYLWQKEFFDGLGRVVQTHAIGETGRTIISSTTTYNNRGLADKKYVSQDLDSGQVNGYKTPEASWKYTTYAYDGIGRVSTQTNPDTTTISHAYTDWQDLVTNERGYKKRYFNDAFKRLGKVEEFSSTWNDEYTFVTKWGTQGSGDGQFNNPHGVAVDSQDNIYVVDMGNHRIQKFNSSGTFLGWFGKGNITTGWHLPGSGETGSWGTGDGQFFSPSGIAIDSQDNVYVADNANHRIQKFNSSGTFITKWGTNGSGDGQFNYPSGVAVDSQDNVYVADRDNHRMQKFNSGGTFITKWGTNGTGDGQFNTPYGVAVDSQDKVYVADTLNYRIQKFNSSGTFVTKWGTQGTGDGQFTTPYGIAVDSQDKVYIADSGNHRVQKFTSYGGLLYKWGTQGSGDGQFYHPRGIGVGSQDTIYVTDTYNHRIQKFSPPPLAPIAEYSFSTKWGTLGSGDGQLNNPYGVAVDSQGNILVVDCGNHRIQKFNSFGTFITKWGSYGTGDGQFDSPGAVAVDSQGNVYVADTYNHRIQKFNSSGTFVTKWGSLGSGDGQFSYPRGIAIDSQNNVYVADKVNNRIQKFNSSGTFITKWGSYGSGDGQFYYPHGVAVDSQNNVYVSECNNHRVQKFSSTGTFITKWGSYGTGDGQFAYPWGISVDSQGYIYVADSNAYRIQKFSSSGTFVTKFGEYGTGDGQFHTPLGVTVDSQRYLYVADTYNNRVQKFTNAYGTTTYTYDVLNNLSQVVDHRNNTTSMTYDWLSRKTAMTDPDMGSWSYGYDNNGNLTNQTDAKSQTVTMTYDTINRLTGKASTGLGVTYTYDAYESGVNYGKGKRTGMIDGTNDQNHPSTYKYDARGCLVEEKRWIYWNNDWGSYTTAFSYDGADRTYQITYPTNEVVTNGYNGRGLPNTLSGNVAGTLVNSTLYNNLGQVKEINLGSNVLKTTYGYWGIDYQTTNYSRLWEIKTVDNDPPDTLRQRVQHTWDADGNLTQRQDLVASETENFTYDFLDRLTAVSGAYSESFTYNEIGNIISKTSGGTTRSYSYGTKPHAVTGLTNPTATYDYDANGNMLIGTARTWDIENRLTSITKDGVTNDYVYDGDGNRVKKTVGGTTTLYINKYYEKNLTASEITTYYYLGDKMVALKKGGDLRYIHQDHLSSTTLVTDTSGNVPQGVTAMKFYPFGAARSGSVPTDILFTGQRRDISTAGAELYYYGARYYDPVIARFISADTFVQSPANLQAWNRYSYAINNPLKYFDPTGHIVKIGPLTINNNAYGTAYDYSRLPTKAEFLIVQAWERFKEVAPDVAKLMEESQTSYTIGWHLIGGQGSITIGDDGDQWIALDKNLEGASTEKIAVSIAHESVHARQGEQIPNIYEEVVAYLYEYEISNKLGIDPGLSAAAKDINLGATGYALDKNLLAARYTLSTAWWPYRFFLPGSARTVLPIPVGGGFSLWGYNQWGTPIIGMNDPSTYSDYDFLY